MARITRIQAKVDQLPLRGRNKQRVRQRILSAASELFKTRGYPPTTMDGIAEKAEISRAAPPCVLSGRATVVQNTW